MQEDVTPDPLYWAVAKEVYPDYREIQMEVAAARLLTPPMTELAKRVLQNEETRRSEALKARYKAQKRKEQR